jgi:hypothetical protein
MPEVPLCVICRKPINKAEEDYVITNKDKEKYEDKYLYAHAACQKK